MLKVFRDCPEAVLPIRGTPGAAGYDLSSVENVRILPKAQALVSTGLRMVIPDGMYGRIAPRSGLAVRHGIDVGAGVVDGDYRGVVKVLLFNLGAEEFVVSPGDRIAQLILTYYGHVDVVEVDEIDTADSVRGSNGFGSTGRA